MMKETRTAGLMPLQLESQPSPGNRRHLRILLWVTCHVSQIGFPGNRLCGELQKRYRGMLSRDPPGKEVRGELH